MCSEKNLRKLRPGLPVRARRRGTNEDAGEPVGTVDKVENDSYLKLARGDSCDHRHHWLSVELIDHVDHLGVHLNRTVEEFRRAILDEIPETQRKVS
jgi:hypothetical protein